VRDSDSHRLSGRLPFVGDLESDFVVVRRTAAIVVKEYSSDQKVLELVRARRRRASRPVMRAVRPVVSRRGIGSRPGTGPCSAWSGTSAGVSTTAHKRHLAGTAGILAVVLAVGAFFGWQGYTDLRKRLEIELSSKVQSVTDVTIAASDLDAALVSWLLALDLARVESRRSDTAIDKEFPPEIFSTDTSATAHMKAASRVLMKGLNHELGLV